MYSRSFCYISCPFYNHLGSTLFHCCVCVPKSANSSPGEPRENHSSRCPFHIVARPTAQSALTAPAGRAPLRLVGGTGRCLPIQVSAPMNQLVRGDGHTFIILDLGPCEKHNSKFDRVAYALSSRTRRSYRGRHRKFSP